LEVGKAVDAELGLYGELEEGDDEVEAKITIVDIRTGRKMLDGRFKKEGKKRIFRLMREVSKAIVGLAPPKGEVVKIKINKDLILNIGKEDGLVIDQVFDVFRKGEKKISFDTGEVIGKRLEYIGKIKIKDVDDKIALAEGITPDVVRRIRKGDQVKLHQEKERSAEKR
jgi:DNA helicase TIP49 (TBP-interacting protein)